MSNLAVIRRVRGQLYFMLQVCELRKLQLIQATVRLSISLLCVFVLCMVRLPVCVCSVGTVVYVICHMMSYYITSILII